MVGRTSGDLADPVEAQPVEPLADPGLLGLIQAVAYRIVPLPPAVELELPGRLQPEVEHPVAQAAGVEAGPVADLVAVAEGVDARPGFLIQVSTFRLRPVSIEVGLDGNHPRQA